MSSRPKPTVINSHMSARESRSSSGQRRVLAFELVQGTSFPSSRRKTVIYNSKDIPCLTRTDSA